MGTELEEFEERTGKFEFLELEYLEFEGIATSKVPFLYQGTVIRGTQIPHGYGRRIWDQWRINEGIFNNGINEVLVRYKSPYS